MISNIPILKGGTAQERALEMGRAFPGVKFLDYEPTPEEIAVSQLMRLPTLLLPRAIMEYDGMSQGRHDYKDWQAIMQAFSDLWRKPPGYVTFTMLKFHTGLSFESVMQILFDQYIEDVLIVRLDVDKGIGGDWKYTRVNKIAQRSEKDDPKWKMGVYRG